jgi:broad specificity polyphosphatase/5'/3'-nucleotidase SurE
MKAETRQSPSKVRHERVTARDALHVTTTTSPTIAGATDAFCLEASALSVSVQLSVLSFTCADATIKPAHACSVVTIVCSALSPQSCTLSFNYGFPCTIASSSEGPAVGRLYASFAENI